MEKAAVIQSALGEQRLLTCTPPCCNDLHNGYFTLLFQKLRTAQVKGATDGGARRGSYALDHAFFMYFPLSFQNDFFLLMVATLIIINLKILYCNMLK